MTKSQIWVASLLVLFLLLFGLSQITKKEPKKEIVGSYMGGEKPAQTSEQTALTLIKSNGCTSCHGSDLNGSTLGPSLIGLKQFWSSRDDLINYLRNPSSFMDKDRFKNYQEKYSSVVMPPFNNLDVKDLGKIADYLRGL
ncbi:MAG: cytochrome c [Ignavibacteriales bacterium]|nr:cytochrome c [Ignavibacteriales bacterium]